MRDSDGTVIFSTANRLSAGPLRALEFAIRQRKPHLHVHAGLRENAAQALADWLRQNQIRVLNVAGPRASKDPRVGAFVRSVLGQALGSASQT